jgi:hypothetical protein
MLFESFNYQSDHGVTCDLETHCSFGHLSTQAHKSRTIFSLQSTEGSLCNTNQTWCMG